MWFLGSNTILKNAVDPMGFKGLWCGLAEATINKDTYTIAYLYGGQVGEVQNRVHLTKFVFHWVCQVKCVSLVNT